MIMVIMVMMVMMVMKTVTETFIIMQITSISRRTICQMDFNICYSHTLHLQLVIEALGTNTDNVAQGDLHHSAALSPRDEHRTQITWPL